MAPSRFNISGLYRSLSSHHTAKRPHFSDIQNSFLYIFPSSCDIFVTVVGLLWHVVTNTYLPRCGEHAGGSGSATFRNVLFRRRNSPWERRNSAWECTVKISATWLVATTLHTTPYCFLVARMLAL
jgi:hypothetical protein